MTESDRGEPAGVALHYASRADVEQQRKEAEKILDPLVKTGPVAGSDSSFISCPCVINHCPGTVDIPLSSRYRLTMKSNRRTNPPYLNGVPELLILHLLSAQPRHGYDLVQAIRDSTGEELQFGEGCIYPILHRLESEGHLQSSRQMVAGRSRVIYRVTAKGKRQLADSVSAWQRVVEVVGRALKGSQDGQPEIA